ncbi:hypothetical protein B5K11_09605 [Rhizobium leguminosarum bv. trifolii]|uniref:hypothetical protein n=1 Tax=Rhizobium leguminosarum TaxID=384 RepID=UPI000E2F8958|nr:hypothetical protein [Rhizobium leguminosarum]RFB95198.1 hypothetical protein B5K11_09605 [Rhizobium leguminosarum bv. trifolii]
MRASHEHQQGRLKAATRAVVTQAGTAAQLASGTRVSESQINKYVGPAYPDFMPLDVVLDAELLAGAPIITQALASIQGYRLVPVDGAVAAPIGVKDTVRLLEGLMHVVSAIHAAVADDTVDEGEKREIERKLSTHMMDVQDVLARVRQAEG